MHILVWTNICQSVFWICITQHNIHCYKDGYISYSNVLLIIYNVNYVINLYNKIYLQAIHLNAYMMLMCNVMDLCDNLIKYIFELLVIYCIYLKDVLHDFVEL